MDNKRKEQLIEQLDNIAKEMRKDFAAQLESDAKIKEIQYVISFSAEIIGIVQKLSKNVIKDIFFDIVGIEEPVEFGNEYAHILKQKE